MVTPLKELGELTTIYSFNDKTKRIEALPTLSIHLQANTVGAWTMARGKKEKR